MPAFTLAFPSGRTLAPKPAQTSLAHAYADKVSEVLMKSPHGGSAKPLSTSSSATVATLSGKLKYVVLRRRFSRQAGLIGLLISQPIRQGDQNGNGLIPELLQAWTMCHRPAKHIIMAWDVRGD